VPEVTFIVYISLLSSLLSLLYSFLLSFSLLLSLLLYIKKIYITEENRRREEKELEGDGVKKRRVKEMGVVMSKSDGTGREKE